MKLKIDKDQFFFELERDVQSEIQRAFIQKTPSYYGEDVKVDFNEIIARAVTAGVSEAISKLIDSQYTDEDFERDIGLKD